MVKTIIGSLYQFGCYWLSLCVCALKAVQSCWTICLKSLVQNGIRVVCSLMVPLAFQQKREQTVQFPLKEYKTNKTQCT